MITSNYLAAIFPYTSARLRDRFIVALNRYLPIYGINTPKRVAAFMATAGVETDYFRTTVEYASGVDYEGRRDLGNTHEADGRRFKGRGVFQTTGRFNYSRLNQTVGTKLGIDFLRNPERLAEIDVAVESACIFWQDNKLAKYADTGEFKKFSSVVNTGSPNRTPNHWSKRNELYSLCTRKTTADICQFTAKPLISQLVTSANDSASLVHSDVQDKPPTVQASMSLKEFGSKYLVHAPFDSLKNILLVLFGRIVAIVLGLWNLGFHGRALVFLIAFAAIVPLVWAVVTYRSRLFGWVKDVVDAFLGNN